MNRHRNMTGVRSNTFYELFREKLSLFISDHLCGYAFDRIEQRSDEPAGHPSFLCHSFSLIGTNANAKIERQRITIGTMKTKARKPVVIGEEYPKAYPMFARFSFLVMCPTLISAGNYTSCAINVSRIQQKEDKAEK